MTMDKKRVIIDFRNITQELLQLLTDTFPYGYEDAIVKFKNSKGEWVRAVALEDDSTKYLVKVGIELERRVEAFLDDDSDEGDDTDSLGDLDDARMDMEESDSLSND